MADQELRDSVSDEFPRRNLRPCFADAFEYCISIGFVRADFVVIEDRAITNVSIDDPPQELVFSPGQGAALAELAQETPCLLYTSDAADE